MKYYLQLLKILLKSRIQFENSIIRIRPLYIPYKEKNYERFKSHMNRDTYLSFKFNTSSTLFDLLCIFLLKLHRLDIFM